MKYSDLQHSLQKNGFSLPPTLAETGRFIRWSGTGDSRSKSSWLYIPSSSTRYGVAFYGDWRTGQSYIWHDDGDRSSSWHDEALTRKAMDMIRRKEREEREKEEKKRIEGLDSFLKDECEPCDKHGTPYTIRKGIKGMPYPDTYRKGDTLCIRAGKTAQMILPDGQKRFCRGIGTSGQAYTFHGEGNTILCEGWATGASIHEATGWTVICALSAHNMKAVYDAMDEDVRRQIWICADYDAPPASWTEAEKARYPKGTGQREAEKTGISQERIVYPDAKGDFNDMAIRAGDDALRGYLEKATIRPSRIKGIEELLGGLTPLHWLVRGVIPEQSIGFIYGAPGSLKTTIAVDLLSRLSLGLPWMGRKTKQCKVLYCCGEGRYGFLQKARAWETRNGKKLSGDWFRIFDGADGVDEVRNDIAALADGWKPDLIVLDTWAQFFRGEENSAGETSQALRALRKLANGEETSVLVIHHAAKSPSASGGQVMRGSSALLGAADYALSVEKERDEQTGDYSAIIKCEKEKDAEEFRPLMVSFDKVELGMLDEDGRPVVSLVAMASDAPDKNDRRGAIVRDSYELVAKAIEERQVGKRVEGKGWRVKLSDWRRFLLSQGLTQSQASHWTERTDGRPLQELIRSGIAVRLSDGGFALSEENMPPPF